MGSLDNQRNSRRLAIEILDETAETDPDRIYAEIPISPHGYDKGFHKITFRLLANAVNGIAWWLQDTLGPSEDFETLAYIGPNDLGHVMLLLGAVKAGFKVKEAPSTWTFKVPLVRHSVLAQVRLLEATGCQKMLIPQAGASSPLIESISTQSKNPQVIKIPNLSDLLGSVHKAFPYTKTFEQARKEPLVVLHTSGTTTGFPKPLIWTHEWAASYAHQLNLAPPKGYDSLDKLMLRNRVFCLMPPFLTSGLINILMFTLFCNSTVILPPVDLPPSASLAVEAAKRTKVEIIICSPPYVEELGDNVEFLETLVQHGAPTISWAGGLVSQKAGDTITSRLKLFNCCGTTEMGGWPGIRKDGPWDPSIWYSLCIHPSANIQFQQVTDDLYLAVAVKNAVTAEQRQEDDVIQPVFRLFPDIEEYDTHDLFKKLTEPGKEHLWQHCGRSDDLQSFSTGEKVHPVATEQLIIKSCPIVQEALLVITGRPKAVLLIELKESVYTGASFSDENTERATLDDLISQVWPAVKKANEILSAYAQVEKTKIIITHPLKPLPRTAKGSVQRKQAVVEYDEEIRAVLKDEDVIQF